MLTHDWMTPGLIDDFWISLDVPKVTAIFTVHVPFRPFYLNPLLVLGVQSAATRCSTNLVLCTFRISHTITALEESQTYLGKTKARHQETVCDTG
jgi:hypothetical protein